MLLYQRFTLMWRVKKKLIGLTTIKINLVNSRKANAMAKIGRTEPKDMQRGKARLLNAIIVVVQTTLQRNAKLPNTWLNCTKNP
jgi:hypothetical protein